MRSLSGGQPPHCTVFRLWNILLLFPIAGPIPGADVAKRTNQGSQLLPCLSTARLSDDYHPLSSFNHHGARPSKGIGIRLIPTAPIDFVYRNSPCLTPGISAALHRFGRVAFVLLAALCADYPSLQ